MTLIFLLIFKLILYKFSKQLFSNRPIDLKIIVFFVTFFVAIRMVTNMVLIWRGIMDNIHSEKPSAFRSFLALLKMLKWPIGITIFALILALIETIAGLVVPLVTKDLVDSLATSLFDWKMIALLFIIFIAQAVTGGVSFYLLTYIGERVVADLREKLWHKLLRLPIVYYDQNETGETMSRITQDTSTLKQLITQHMVQIISGVISILGAVILLFFIDWKMTLILLTSVPISFIIIMPLGRIMHKIAVATQQEMASFSGFLGRVLSDIRLVKSYRAEESEDARGGKAIQSLFRFGLKEAKVQAFISPVMTLIMMSVLVVILGYGGSQVASGALTAGELVAIIFYLVQIIVPFAQIASFFTSFQKAMGATERIQHIFSIASEEYTATEVADNDDIRFEHVSFAYSEDKEVLQDITFVAKPGTMTAFAGPSGGGKTTIFSLLERFYQPTNGDIYIGKTPINNLSLNEWRGKIGYVSQESPLLSGSIIHNITYGIAKQPSLELVISAAKDANALEFIDKLSDGFDTEVGERGIKLSGGQRQRIAIARALLHNPSILLLDEATSNLDSGSEILVQEALQRLMAGRTTFIIAHRLATIAHANQILFIENGNITGTGTHEQLLSSHALYREFAAGQGLF